MSEQHAGFEEIHGKDPIIFWETMCSDRRTTDLAKFALTLLCIVMNTAANERSFSDLKVEKTRLRNRIGVKKVGKMMKIRGHLHRVQYKTGLKIPRKPRKNHKEERLSKLLEVPQYAKALDSPGGETEDNSRGHHSALVRSRKDWRREFVKWGEQAWTEGLQVETTDDDVVMDSNFLDPVPQLPAGRSLALFFGGCLEQSANLTLDGYIECRRTQRQGWSEEALHMELLAQEEEDQIPDDGELEGSGDEYDR
ncbi:hypothetical protein D9758_009743 [Tetrapyrgos nigripes]|uniref:HAT C-terminal dimerisation domain-containing protein n=1 Tax=Tetrapyrgos nigripes TaxID=182062 RepID=A0A8H5GKI4_9AGAR|nr:hypothetical protein D9758_009743 [Tetrapyrgos nigripes]